VLLTESETRISDLRTKLSEQAKLTTEAQRKLMQPQYDDRAPPRLTPAPAGESSGPPDRIQKMELELTQLRDEFRSQSQQPEKNFEFGPSKRSFQQELRGEISELKSQVQELLTPRGRELVAGASAPGHIMHTTPERAASTPAVKKTVGTPEFSPSPDADGEFSDGDDSERYDELPLEEFDLKQSKHDNSKIVAVGGPLPWSDCLEQELRVLLQSKHSLQQQKRRLKAQYLSLEEDRQQWRQDVKSLKKMGVRCQDRQVLGSVKAQLDEQSSRMNSQVRMLRSAEKSVDTRIYEVRQLIGPDAETAMGLGVGQESLSIPDFSNVLLTNPDSAASTPLGLYRKWRSYIPTLDMPMSARTLADMPMSARGMGSSSLSGLRSLAPPMSARGLPSTDASFLIGSTPLYGASSFSGMVSRLRHSSLYN